MEIHLRKYYAYVPIEKNYHTHYIKRVKFRSFYFFLSGKRDHSFRVNFHRRKDEKFPLEKEWIYGSPFRRAYTYLLGEFPSIQINFSSFEHENDAIKC